MKLNFREWVVDLDAMAKQAKLDISKYDRNELMMGIEAEKEHDGKMGKDIDIINKKSDLLKVAVAHLREDPKYYTKLKKVEKD